MKNNAHKYVIVTTRNIEIVTIRKMRNVLLILSSFDLFDLKAVSLLNVPVSTDVVIVLKLVNVLFVNVFESTDSSL